MFGFYQKTNSVSFNYCGIRGYTYRTISSRVKSKTQGSSMQDKIYARIKRIAFASGLFVTGCQDSGVVLGDLGCAHDAHLQSDLAPAPAKCAAAQGLSGDVLLCVDFDKVAGLDAPELKGWDFNLNCDDGTKWEIVSGKMQVTNLSALKAVSNGCKFMLPAINMTDPDKKKYQSVTISILHTVDLSEGDFLAQIFLGVEDPLKRLLAQMNGSQKRQISTFNLPKSDLPQGENNYKYLFKVYKSSDRPVCAIGILSR